MRAVMIPLSFVVALLAGLAPAARAGSEPLASALQDASAGPGQLEEWRRSFAEMETAAQAGRWPEVAKKSERVLDQLAKNLGGGGADAAWYGTALVYLALARAGQGDHPDATWWWWTARHVWPASAERDLSAYGATGELLRSLGPPDEPRSTRETTEAGEAKPPEPAGDEPPSGISPPVLLKRVNPDYPRAAKGQGGECVIQAVIAEDGSVREPVIERATRPDIDLAALRALRQWRYKPAVMDGRPRAVFLMVKLKFHVQDGN